MNARTLSAVAAIFFICAALSATAAPKLTTLYSFRGGADGAFPEDPVIYQEGMLYGTTYQGGNSGCYGNSCGTLFKVDADTGAETVLHSFANNPDGAYPRSPLLEVGGLLFGTTEMGGTGDVGTVFRFDPTTGAERVLYSFTGGADGGLPWAGLTAHGSKLYGTSVVNNGNVFSFDPNTGGVAVVHSFTFSDGDTPLAGVISRGDALFGAAYQGSGSYGNVYTIDLETGVERALHSFDGGARGGSPAGGVIEQNGYLYGTTYQGGKVAASCSYGCGTVFRVDPRTGAETVVYAFTGRADGQYPQSALIAVGDALYGTNRGAKAGCDTNGCGTVFKIDRKTGKETVVHSFTGGADGGLPLAALTYAGGAFYGTTTLGGSGLCNCGTVFKLTP